MEATQAPAAAFAIISNWIAFHVSLNKRVNEPQYINQSTTSLCGPAAFMYCVAKHQPEVYRRYVLDLAEHGKARIGQLEIIPSDACRRTKGVDIDPVDWIALASLRDSTNRMMSMSKGGNTAAGITTPGDLESWFDRCGLFHGTGNYTQAVTGSNLHTIIAANASHSTGSFVCLLVRAAIISGVGNAGTKFRSNLPKTASFTPDHWIVLAEPILIGGRVAASAVPAINTSVSRPQDQHIDVRVYSWGKYYRITDVYPELTAGQFLRYFYGHVAAGI